MCSIFQSTLPSQGATFTINKRSSACLIFQSTLPSQGATGTLVSIRTTKTFQSSLPSRGATTCRRELLVCLIFQSSLPSQGATCCNLIKHITHTDFNPRSPHRERLIVFTFDVFVTIFQSTLPSQGATEIDRYPASAGTISIHAPLTGSDPEQLRSRHIHKIFQSTLPSQGATSLHSPHFRPWCNFNPRSPHRERRRNRCILQGYRNISIHAPLTGSDAIG